MLKRTPGRFWQNLLHGVLGGLILLATACNAAPEAPPTATAVVMVRRLATIAPTRPPDATDLAATQQAQLITPTLPPPTLTPTPTPYIGVFLGEAELGEGVGDVDPLSLIILPTRIFPNPSMICADDPDLAVFGDAWAEDISATDGLRCPIQQSYGFYATMQIFEHGAMYQNPETSEVWAIAPGASLRNGYYWYVDHPPAMSTQGIEAPTGLIVPGDALGAVWVSNPELRAALGYAVTRRQNGSVNIQRYEGGTLFLDAASGQVFALLVTGITLGPYNLD